MRRATGLAALALVAAWLALHSWQQAAGHLRYSQLAAEMSFWPRPDYHPSAQVRAQTRQAVAGLAQRFPANPDYLALAAYNQHWEWYWRGDDQAGRQALALQRASLRQRPALRRAWQTQGEYASALGDAAALAEAQQRIAALAPAAQVQ